MNYPKLVQKLKKAFPDITQEELDDMISKVPPNLPTAMIDSLIALTKACQKDPNKIHDLKKVNVLDHIKIKSKRSR